MYKLFFQLVFKRMDPERAHYAAFRWIRLAARIPVLRTFVAAALAPRFKELRTEALGLRMHGPFGLAAGFDKNAVAIDGMSMLGFDHIEIGTVTGEPQPGNPRPRLARLPADRAVVNRMGFNNDGAEIVARRLAERRLDRTGRLKGVPPGINIGKTKAVPEEYAVRDYEKSTTLLTPYADYLVVNVSSPNTPGLRDLQAVDRLEPLLRAVRRRADDLSDQHVPLLVKIAPDLSDEDVRAVADLATSLALDGIVATNTTVSRAGLDTPGVDELGSGGISGHPVAARSLEVLRRLYRRVGDRLVLVSVGGIETVDDAWERIISGASLLQGYTGFVYGGGLWAKHIHDGVARRLHDGGFATLADAVGSAIEREQT